MAISPPTFSCSTSTHNNSPQTTSSHLAMTTPARCMCKHVSCTAVQQRQNQGMQQGTTAGELVYHTDTFSCQTLQHRQEKPGFAPSKLSGNVRCLSGTQTNA
ncbi:hypothetical protein ILYODFUR_023656 [Ilyodon furcidens]|uniref:Uncharacterized protein n=1 Tax=Ilyodon furcidens TaxID=33524 RepID=A0ABV0TL29_9TELE